MTRPRLAATTLLGLLAALIAHGPASAQQNDISPLPVDPATSPLRCLQQPEPPLEYPAEARRLQLDGTVRVGLAFTAPDRPPEVEVLARFADERFVNAVRERVAAYRLPCQAAARGTVRAVQTPQVFRARVLIAAHEASVGREATDDAALVRELGYRVVATDGHPWGLKVTHAGDLALATFIAENS